MAIKKKFVPMSISVIVTTGPAYYRYYQFWLKHLLPIFSVLYMTFVHGFRVKAKDVWKPFVFMAVLAGFLIWGNSTKE